MWFWLIVLLLIAGGVWYFLTQYQNGGLMTVFSYSKSL